MNEIYLRRRGKLWVKAGEGGATAQHIAAVQKEAQQLGFVLSEAVMARLATLSLAELTEFLRRLLRDLRVLVGAHRVHTPLYPRFPLQVLSLSEAERYLDAVHHYLTLKRVSAGDTPAAPPLLHGLAPREIGLGSVEEFESLFTRLAGARSSLSEQDKADVEWFVRQYRDGIFRLLPRAIPFKENLALVGAALLRHTPGTAAQALLRDQVKTATDVLRLAVALSGGDVSLAKSTRFQALKRQHRKLLLDLLEQGGDPTEDMLRWGERWKRLGERLHPREFEQRFPRACAAFAVLRNKQPFSSFNSTVEAHLRTGQVEAAALALATRPGDFARRLDHLLRLSQAPSDVLQPFRQVCPRVSTPVLLQVLVHFRHRGQHPLRAFFPKGEVAKVYALAEQRSALPQEAVEQVTAICEGELLRRFSALPPLGACFVDPGLRHYLVPFSQRSASRSLRTLVRGSRLPMPDAGFVRLFLWWMNGRGRTDIDLSAVLFGPDFDYIDALTYYKLQNYGGYHSGDVVDAPQGAAEFIDLDLRRLRELRVRFVVMVLNSYTLQPYCDLPECFAGWMSRQELNSGEAFEPQTVVDRVDLASDAGICLPLVLDLQERCVVWMDLALKVRPRWNNVRNHLSGVSLMLRAITSLVKPDLHTLFTLHARARGRQVDLREGAETVFSVQDGVTPFDVDRIRAEFL
ncbi:TerD family protein [Caldimonas brevitalea]|uniref:Cytoplasmic protein n=1 Tax=Caldimonas brevitalea TaxID=413882 RepID=A0A0G3BL70_9BURK|nr:TerD family protein [Caldimonas brevitalea]AKJ30152.1 hypothetical protein AAW51_3461 [Caldimonas brevitalea]